MNALDLLATSLNQKNEKPNEALAIEIIQSKRNDWIKELVTHLQHSDKNIQSDCIKVLYEIGERGSADMIAPYYKDFGGLLKSKNNRLVWGAMTALDTITLLNPNGVFELLPSIMEAIDKGSVITIDHGVGILAKLSGIPEYSETTFPLLIEQLRKCPPKQLPMYAEKTATGIRADNKPEFLEVLKSRYPEMTNESQKQRLNRIIVKLTK